MGQQNSSDDLTIIFGVIATVLAASTLVQTARLADRRKRCMLDEERGFDAETPTITTPSTSLEATANRCEEVQSVQQVSSSKTSRSSSLDHSLDVVIQDLSLMPPSSVIMGWNSISPSTVARAVNEQVIPLATLPSPSPNIIINRAADTLCVDMECKKAKNMTEVTQASARTQRACAANRAYCLRGFRCHCKSET